MSNKLIYYIALFTEILFLFSETSEEDLIQSWSKNK